MTHKPIFIESLSLCFPHKTCFEDFSISIHNGAKIALIGANGSGKTSLLKLVCKAFEHQNVSYAFVPQLIDLYDSLSGGERFQKSLSEALSQYPDILVLDEPTNHLDLQNKKNLLHFLKKWKGTLLVVSHDPALLSLHFDQIWSIEEQKVTVFMGSYSDFNRERQVKYDQIQNKLKHLDRERKEVHLSLMKEQERAKKSDLRGQKSIRQNKWPTIVSDEKARRSIETSGKKKHKLKESRTDLAEQLQETRLPESLSPKFALQADLNADKMLVSVSEAWVAYKETQKIFNGLHFSLYAKDRVALLGSNGSGKTTFVKAILGYPEVLKGGDWSMPNSESIGYLDQHYQNLDPELSVIETIQKCCPEWDHVQLRRFLNDFLFRKTEEVETKVKCLSGGEKLRLSLAQIAAKPPKLLILDEVTNNIDLVMRAHLVSVLKAYPGAFLVISHDEDFLEEINISARILLGPP